MDSRTFTGPFSIRTNFFFSIDDAVDGWMHKAIESIQPRIPNVIIV